MNSEFGIQTDFNLTISKDIHLHSLRFNYCEHYYPKSLPQFIRFQNVQCYAVRHVIQPLKNAGYKTMIHIMLISSHMPEYLIVLTKFMLYI